MSDVIFLDKEAALKKIAPTMPKMVLADVKVKHCGNFLGLWAPGASWWCRKCRRLIDSNEALA